VYHRGALVIRVIAARFLPPKRLLITTRLLVRLCLVLRILLVPVSQVAAFATRATAGP